VSGTEKNQLDRKTKVFLGISRLRCLECRLISLLSKGRVKIEETLVGKIGFSKISFDVVIAIYLISIFFYL
jgi:hypothetical protein